jgi:hypothetical protein
VVAIRTVRRLLQQGEVVGLLPEGERSHLGDYQGALPGVGELLAGLGAPVVPVGITGSYEVGPRWAGMLRRRPVRLSVGDAIDWTAGDPQTLLDAAIVGQLDELEPAVHLAGLPRDRLRRALWACPRCFEEAGWDAAALACSRCGARYVPTSRGRLADQRGAEHSLASLGRPLVARAGLETRLACRAVGYVERACTGPILPLVSLGEGLLVLTPTTITFGDLAIPVSALRSATTERADTLQLATATAMWQFRPAEASVFRLQAAVSAWIRRGRAGPAGRRPAPAEAPNEPAVGRSRA